MGRRQTIGMTGKTALENFMIELVKIEHMYYNKKEQMFVRLRAPQERAEYDESVFRYKAAAGKGAA